jgi:hypothetical protein
MIRRRGSWGLAAALLSLLALPVGVDARGAKYGNYVLGVQPNDVFVKVYPGRIKSGEFREKIFALADFADVVSDGYIVRRAPAGTTFAIAMIRKDGKDYTPCDGEETLTFTVREGKTVYLGEILYRSDSDGLRYSVDRDADRAKAHVQATHPEMTEPVEDMELAYTPVATVCPVSTITIPIYVPAPQ